MVSFVQFLPLGVNFLIAITTIITFYLSYFKYEHVTYFLPYISDTGTFPPESCIFGQSLNFASILIALAVYLKFLQVQEIQKKHHMEDKLNINKITCFFGFSASLGLNFVGNFQETNMFQFHWFSAILVFGCGSLYLIFQTILYVKISPILGQRKSTLFRIILALISLISFILMISTGFMAYKNFTGNDVTKWKISDGGYNLHQISTISEWICASCILSFIGLFHEEFKTIRMEHVKISLLEHIDHNINNEENPNS